MFFSCPRGQGQATRLLNTGKSVGLTERIKQSQGKPARIYVKRSAKFSGLAEVSVQISASLPFQVDRAEFRLPATQFPLPMLLTSIRFKR